MAWNDIRIPLRDRGLNGARKYLVEQKGITNDRCIFYNGTFEAIAALKGPFQLYIVAHGYSDSAEMGSGDTLEDGRQSWDAERLAKELITRGFPGNQAARIKLCVCFGADEIQTDKHVPGIFAKQVARQMYMSRRYMPFTGVNAHPQGPTLQGNPFAEVFVGGFTVEVKWDKHHYPSDADHERAIRIYYPCAQTPEAVTHAPNQLRRGVVADDLDFRSGHFLHRQPTHKWGQRAKPAHGAPKFAFFPYDYPTA